MTNGLITLALACAAPVIVFILVRWNERAAKKDLERYRRGELEDNGIFVRPFWRGRGKR